MSADLRLVIFDVDGTLVDSQNHIVAGMRRAFGSMGMDAPSHSDILATVGLSLSRAIEELAPDVEPSHQAEMVDAYKMTYRDLRMDAGSKQSSPLYDGIADVLQNLHAVDPLLMGVATGKSRRGLDALLDAHQLRSYFVTRQCADDHSSKPHPSMVLSAMADAGVSPEETVVVGDTRFDMEMARAAGAGFVGVSWGYHDRSQLAGADAIVDRVSDLTEAVLRAGAMA
ncbi:MAG: HAD-IA family hydrolase [Pseudomonadota bacterium]